MMSKLTEAAANAGLDAAAVQFEALRVDLDALDMTEQEQDFYWLMDDARNAFCVAFKRSMKSRLDEYLDARGDDAAADAAAANADYAAYQQKRDAWSAYIDDRTRD
jgi:hypothetical protein